MQNNIQETLNHCKNLLLKSGIQRPLFEARLLIQHASGIPIQKQIGWPEKLLSTRHIIKLNKLLLRRCNHEPYAYLVGKKSFYEIEVRVTKDTLIPRPDSEVAVNSLKNIFLNNKPKSILDLGTGSGVLLLSLLKLFPKSSGVGIDLSFSALSVAKRNAKELNMQNRTNFICSNWAACLNQRTFDLVIANPPYIPSHEINKLSNEISFYEPRIALDGGKDGLNKFQPLLKSIKNIVKPDSIVCIEIGQHQERKVASFMRSIGISKIKTNCDLNNKPRCLIGYFK